MNIQKNKKPLVDGKTYYLPVIFEGSMEPITEGGGYFSTPGGRCLLLSPKSVRSLREEVSSIKRCRDCSHAKPVAGRNIYCDFQNTGCCWDKMCSACEHYEPRKEQSDD